MTSFAHGDMIALIKFALVALQVFPMSIHFIPFIVRAFIQFPIGCLGLVMEDLTCLLELCCLFIILWWAWILHLQTFNVSLPAKWIYRFLNGTEVRHANTRCALSLTC